MFTFRALQIIKGSVSVSLTSVIENTDDMGALKNVCIDDDENQQYNVTCFHFSYFPSPPSDSTGSGLDRLISSHKLTTFW